MVIGKAQDRTANVLATMQDKKRIFNAVLLRLGKRQTVSVFIIFLGGRHDFYHYLHRNEDFVFAQLARH